MVEAYNNQYIRPSNALCNWAMPFAGHVTKPSPPSTPSFPRKPLKTKSTFYTKTNASITSITYVNISKAIAGTRQATIGRVPCRPGQGWSRPRVKRGSISQLPQCPSVWQRMRIPFLTCFKPKFCRAREAEEGTDKKVLDRPGRPCGTLAAQANPPLHKDASTSCHFLVEGLMPMGMPRTSVQADAFAFSWAVVDSDDHQVLCYHLGQETAAAQILQQALNAAGRAANPHPASALRFRDCAKPASEGCLSSSFLLTLLGPQMGAAALETAQMGRPWKGPIYAQLPATGHTFDCSANHGSHINATKPAAAEEGSRRGEEGAACRDTANRSSHVNLTKPAAAEKESPRGEEAACRDTAGDWGEISGDRPARKARRRSSIQLSQPSEPDLKHLGSLPQLGSKGISDHVPLNNKPSR
ncbi:hypothetical protein DUNSADRAFT_12716 [Dunaliella salina]|uniref:Encoded protein n=1 Tax=Dunaliella salina TaxID=3046 RepID=A0ABQ7GAQ6_DUNSA|nr:hypothetical protein DUNSADRAFT_12716 [Dunaliella salina]|eukprot:KAF5831693.1 hypothetical protein DUNSADRAFT_12716 [Dunaliella salina]